MKKDWKTGIVLGLAMIPFIAVWIATRPALKTENRIAIHEAADDERSTALLCAPLQVSREEEIDKPVVVQKYIKKPGPAIDTSPKRKPATKQLLQPVKIKPLIHTVTTGQTLSEISNHYYGSSGKWQKILNANKALIKKPKDLRIGMKLVIPQ